MAAEVMMIPDFAPAVPEVLLAVGSMALLMVGVFWGEKSASLVTGLATALLVIAGGAVLLGPLEATTFNGAFVVDPFTRVMKIMALLGSVVAMMMSVGYARTQKADVFTFEYPVLILLATMGMLLMISANDLIAVYLGLELQSLSLYVIAAINRDSARASEAGLKYFVLGALSSGMLLYGMSLVYGFTGHTSFEGIAEAAHGGGTGFIFGLAFILAGLAFKISAVPFHMWTPDVYEGAPTPVTAFFAAAPKVAALALFVRVTYGAFEQSTDAWQQIVVFISIGSMVLGAFAAIGQTNIKRLMAYSSIGHMGYALVGLAAGTQAGVQSVVIYLITYLAMTFGAFACILAMRRSEGMVEDISELAGLHRTNPAKAFFLAMIMFSLAGIPPLAGFIGKFFVFAAAIQADLVALAIIGVLASVVGAFYYIRIVKVIYFDEAAAPFQPMSGELKMVLGISGVFVIGFLIIAYPLVSIAETAAATFF